MKFVAIMPLWVLILFRDRIYTGYIERSDIVTYLLAIKTMKNLLVPDKSWLDRIAMKWIEKEEKMWQGLIDIGVSAIGISESQ